MFCQSVFVAGLGLMLVAPVRAQYTFGPQIQSTNTASLTYSSASNLFQYTDSANASEDSAGLPLAGNAAAEITATNAWTASFTPDLPAQSVPGGGAYADMSLAIIINDNISNAIYIAAAQLNYSGDGSDNYYGTEYYFEAVRNGTNLPTTRQGLAFYNKGICYIALTGSTNASPTTEPLAAISAALSLTCDPATGTLTGGFTQAGAMGSVSLTNWGPNPTLTLAVVGGSGRGINVAAGSDVASNFFVTSFPQLSLVHAGTNVILNWPTNAAGFHLQSTTNFGSPSVWSTNFPAPSVVSGQNTVTNPVSGPRQFYRLSQ